MHRFLPLVLLFAANPAFAGVGTTLGIGSIDIDIANGVVRNNAFLPTLDYRADPLILQFHVLDLIDNLADEEVYIGANVYFEAHRAELTGGWSRVIQPGGSVDIFGDPFILGLAAESRFGIESNGFGIHVVPALGLLVGDVDTELITGGALHVGVWF